MKRRRSVGRPLAIALSLVAMALAACDGPSGPAKPTPGVLVVRLAAPDASDRAVIVTVTGPAAVSAPRAANPAHLLQWRAQGTTLRAAVFGDELTGPVLRFTVPDVAQAARYRATVVEAVDAANTPCADLTAHSATVEPGT